MRRLSLGPLRHRLRNGRPEPFWWMWHRKNPHDNPFSVPYLRYYQRWYRSMAWYFIVLCGGLLAFVATDPWWLTRVFQTLIVAFMAVRSNDSFSKSRWYGMQAWTNETQAAIQGMADAGLYESPQEIIQAIADSPPPGVSVDEWREGAANALRELGE